MASNSGKKIKQVCQLSVFHGPTPEPVVLDSGNGNSTVGAQRFWSFSGRSQYSRKSVRLDWVMLTTSSKDEKERRISDATFSFRKDIKGQIVLNGVAEYSTDINTFNPGSTQKRAATGGTKQAKGVSGQIISERFNNGSWKHTFDLNKDLLSDYDCVTGSKKSDSIETNKKRSILIGTGERDTFIIAQPREKGWDVIVNFKPGQGDKIELRELGLDNEKLRIKTINSREDLDQAKKSDSDLVYDGNTGFLFLNQNSVKDGWGKNGGLFLNIGIDVDLSPTDILIS